MEILFSKSPIIIFCRGHARVQGDRVHDIGARPEMGWIQWAVEECGTRASCPDPITSLSSHQTTSTLAFRTFLIIPDYDGSTNWTKAVIKNEAEKQYYNNPPPLLQPNTRDNQFKILPPIMRGGATTIRGKLRWNNIKIYFKLYFHSRQGSPRLKTLAFLLKNEYLNFC